MPGNNCKLNNCKRAKNKFNDESYGRYGYEDGKNVFYEDNYGWKEDGFEGGYYGWKEDDFDGYKGNYGWGYEDGLKGGKNSKWAREDNYAKKNAFNSKYARDEEDLLKASTKNRNAFEDDVHSRKKHHDDEVDKKKYIKDTDDLNERFKNTEHLNKEAARCKQANRNNKKYLVDKLYIYEHHRVIDLNECENIRDQEEARKEFKDLEAAIRQFRNDDFAASNFSAENRDDLAIYDASRQKLNDLQAQKLIANSDDVYGNNSKYNSAYGNNTAYADNNLYGKNYVWGN